METKFRDRESNCAGVVGESKLGKQDQKIPRASPTAQLSDHSALTSKYHGLHAALARVFFCAVPPVLSPDHLCRDSAAREKGQRPDFCRHS